MEPLIFHVFGHSFKFSILIVLSLRFFFLSFIRSSSFSHAGCEDFWSCGAAGFYKGPG